MAYLTTYVLKFHYFHIFLTATILLNVVLIIIKCYYNNYSATILFRCVTIVFVA